MFPSWKLIKSVDSAENWVISFESAQELTCLPYLLLTFISSTVIGVKQWYYICPLDKPPTVVRDGE